ncbi:unnamed protein product [Somion occarium]|uniref:Nuclear condensin complex subunit 3 C-terminal domain-containing protein n=1 Tax=Somion occarium TaxID=3059160 RepID=A0ABP1CV82_9APHY
MPARTVISLENLPQTVGKIFDQAQNTTANHQKNFVALHKLHTETASHHGSAGERAFEHAFLNMLGHVLPVKKGNPVADRLMRFIGGYTKYMNERAMEEANKRGDDDDAEDFDTTAARFISRVLRFLFKGSVAKDKVVRYRVMQCIAEMISHLGEIDEDLYKLLRETLIERVKDKEVPIRVQATIALSRICGADEEDEKPTIIDVLQETVQYDPSAEVRRAALLNLPLGLLTYQTALSRMRDVDPSVRKAVYASVLNPDKATADPDAIDVTHPRALKIADRERIVKNGLGDREEAVKAAVAKLIATWVDIVQIEKVKIHEGTIAEDALSSVFKTRVDILDSLTFGDDYWTDLSPERAFLARVFVDHCVATKDDVRLESALPVVTMLAFKIQEAYNDLNAFLADQTMDDFLKEGIEDEEEDERRQMVEEERTDREFVIGEMLKLSVNLDYADEIGRRKMFQLVKDMISEEDLPESLVARCLDVLRKLSSSERDLIRVVVEVVHDLRDRNDDEEQADPNRADDGETTFGETPATVKTARAPPKPPAEMTEEERARADAMDMRCLSLCIGMLERVNGTFEENSTLEGLLGELIIPAVKRKEAALREKGLVSLGLCCLIARRMALNSFQLFLNQLQSTPEKHKIPVLKIVFDILMVHEGHFLGPTSPNGDRIVEFLMHVFENSELDEVQALLCKGMAKLMLSGFITDERVLRSLVIAYISPETADNLELRQCLSYFFPVYCYSSAANQRRMQKIFITVFKQLCEIHQQSEDEDIDLISPAQVGLLFADWTDPQKATVVAKGVPGREVDESIHIDLATDIVKELFDDDMRKDDRKALCLLLGKLYIPDTIDDDKIRTLKLLMHNIRARRPLRDLASKNAFVKFETAISKKFEKQLEDFNEEEYRKLEHLQELFEFLDDIIPDIDDVDEMMEAPKKRGSRKRRSDSIVTDATSQGAPSGDDRSNTPFSTTSSVASRTKGKGKAKRRRLSTSDDEDEDTETEKMDSPQTVKPPTRVMPKRSAAAKTRAAVSKVINLVGSDSEEDIEETPSRKPTSNLKKVQKAMEAARIDEKDLAEQEDEIPHDSIMDTTLEEEDYEDEEVNNLL